MIDKLMGVFIATMIIAVAIILVLLINDGIQKRNTPCYDLASSGCLVYRMQQCEAADFTRQECLIIVRELP